MLDFVFWLLLGNRKKRIRRRKSSGASPPYETVVFGPLEAAVWLNRSKGGKANFRFTIAPVSKNGYRRRSLEPMHLLFLPGLVVALAWWFATDSGGYLRQDDRAWLKKLDQLFYSFEFVKVGESVKSVKNALADDLERERVTAKILEQHLAANGRSVKTSHRKVQ